MKRSQQTVYRGISLFLCLTALTVNAQQRTKSYQETFNVGNETILDINTSQADIVFETWDKNQIQIEAIIEVEGVSERRRNNIFRTMPLR
jgi:hypothetical protein